MSPPSQEPHGPEDHAVTDAASTMPHQAAHRVFATPELLCSIAACLLPREIFIAMSVCRIWRETISGDPIIQQILFLKPIELCEVVAEDIYILDLANPIPMQECNIIGEVNPWISDICGQVYGLPSVHTSVNFEFQPCNGLWREMFVTQPPCKAVVVSLLASDRVRAMQRFDFEREAGIKMGELYDFIAEETRYHPECRGAVVALKNFDTEEYAHSWVFPTTRCPVRNGEVCRPVQMPEAPCSGSEYSQDSESGDSDDDHGGNDKTQGVVGYEDYDFESDEEYSDDDEDPDEFAVEQADEADQYFRW